MRQSIDRHALGVCAVGAGIGRKPLLFLGRRFGNYSLSPIVRSGAGCIAGCAGLLMRIVIHESPTTPIVIFNFGFNAASSLADTRMRVGRRALAIIGPIAPVVAEIVNVLIKGCSAIFAGINDLCALGAGGSANLFAVIPTVRLGLGLAAFGILTGASVGVAVFIVNPIAKVAGVGRCIIYRLGSVEVCSADYRTVRKDIAVLP